MFLFFGCLQIASYYLPIYFQTVRGSTAIVSGVHMLPNVLSQLVSTVGSGALGKPLLPPFSPSSSVSNNVLQSDD